MQLKGNTNYNLLRHCCEPFAVMHAHIKLRRTQYSANMLCHRYGLATASDSAAEDMKLATSFVAKAKYL